MTTTVAEQDYIDRQYDAETLQEIASALDDVLYEARSYQQEHPNQSYSFCSRFFRVGPDEWLTAYVHHDRCQLDVVNCDGDMVGTQRLSRDQLEAWHMQASKRNGAG